MCARTSLRAFTLAIGLIAFAAPAAAQNITLGTITPNAARGNRPNVEILFQGVPGNPPAAQITPAVVTLTPKAGGVAKTVNATVSSSIAGAYIARFNVPADIAPAGVEVPYWASLAVTVNSNTYTNSGLGLDFTGLPEPFIHSVTPSSGFPGETVTLTITGRNTFWSTEPGDTQVSLSGSSLGPITVQSVVAGSQPNTQVITAQLTIPLGTPADAVPRSLTVTSPAEMNLSLANAFSVAATVFNLGTITPNAARGGRPNVEISFVNVPGNPTAAQISSAIVTLTPTAGGAPKTAVATVSGPSGGVYVARFTVPADIAPGGVVVPYRVSLGLTISSIAFTSSGPGLDFTGLPEPFIQSVAPATGLPGEIIDFVITGRYTNWSTDLADIAVSLSGSSLGAITVQSVGLGPQQFTQEIYARLTIPPGTPADTAPRSLTVTSAGEVNLTRPNAFSVAAANITLINVLPNAARGNQPDVSVSFRDLPGAPAASQITSAVVTLVPTGGGAARTVNATVTGPLGGEYSARFTVPADIAPGGAEVPYRITLAITAGGVTYGSAGAGLNFTGLPQPTIESVTPPTGVAGQQVDLVITGRYTTWSTVASQTQVAFSGSSLGAITVLSVAPGSQPNTQVITARFTIPANTPADTAARTLTVTSTGEATLTRPNAFSVLAANQPQISLSPSTGARGSRITVLVTGTNTTFVQGTTTMSFGDGITVESLTVNSSTSMTAVVLIGANAALGARQITVTGGAATTLNATFTVAAASSQSLSCHANAGVPPLVRAEGFTELVGDLVLTCTGGTAGLPTVTNVQVFLNTNITSRRLSASDTEALLVVDEAGSPVIYRGQPALGLENAIVWQGVSIIAPGAGQRIIRITNLRANATMIGVSSLIPGQIVAFLSFSPSQSVLVDNPQQIVGYVQAGLRFDLRNCANTDGIGSAGDFFRCIGQNNSGSQNLLTGNTGTMQFSVRFQEAFQTAFKPQVAASQIGAPPGGGFNSESGYVPSTSSQPFAVGGANSGTRLMVRFANIPAGVRLFVTTGQSYGSSAGATAVLVDTGLPSFGVPPLQPTVPVPPMGTATLICPAVGGAGLPAVEIPVANGAASATWEVTAANTTANDTLTFGIAAAYAPNLPADLPGVGRATVIGMFAPAYASTSDAGKGSSILPIPRFVESTTMTNAFRISTCATTLLFPYVTARSGFDTGIAISNTSADPFDNSASRSQSGPCTFHYYGTMATSGASLPAPQTTTAAVRPGQTAAFVVSSGGLGVAGASGFQGYIIARCEFLYAHGFAFITDGPIGQAGVAEGYVALIMDAAGAVRGATGGEALDH
jgi:hypothetical protein